MRLRILTELLLAISLAGVSFATKHPCYNLSVASLVLNPLQHFHTLICISADPNSGIGNHCEWADGEQSLLTRLFYGPVLSNLSLHRMLLWLGQLVINFLLAPELSFSVHYR